MLSPSIHTNLKDKVVLVTGSTRGLGAYYAELLAKNHATVIVSGKTQDKINLVVDRIRQHSGQAVPLVLNMNDISSFNTKIEEIIQQYGHLDVLINNAAMSKDENLFDITEATWDSIMNTNVKGLFFLSQAAARVMSKQEQGGNIINIAGVNCSLVRKNNVVFGTSKAAVIHLTKTMACDLIDSNVRVNALSIGLFPSEAVTDYLENDPSSKQYLAQIPMKRAGKLSELDGPLLLLASDASSYMHGTVLTVDGGFAIKPFVEM